MSASPLPETAALAARLGVPAEHLRALDGCAAEDVALLDDAVELALRAEDRAVSDGLAAAVRFVPRPLRGRARALLGVGRG
ncbi:hypothetical protein RDV89_05425 [Nocardioides zeae]|uniref:Uncharacterized protein n=1 Tax=Nocardioides imazamoxiresistens TaxID=3231893 RepID=A0ABU3PUG7_9ACTN|nr:hypothetical protein [Nocardioides zeae]MDT9592497.1 hypothetical protein [Nocardioides zeae]